MPTQANDYYNQVCDELQKLAPRLSQMTVHTIAVRNSQMIELALRDGTTAFQCAYGIAWAEELVASFNPAPQTAH